MCHGWSHGFCSGQLEFEYHLCHLPVLWLGISVPQFPHSYNGNNYCNYLAKLWELSQYLQSTWKARHFAKCYTCNSYLTSKEDTITYFTHKSKMQSN
jgi:hypothetical protein